MASFSYYGSVLSSSELLEKNLLCLTDAGGGHDARRHLLDGHCYCLPFASSDYETLLISSLGEVARKSWLELRHICVLLRPSALVSSQWSRSTSACSTSLDGR